MKGNFLRYLSEVKTGDEKSVFVSKSKDAYGEATEAASDLQCTHPIKLGIALEFSAFLYEIMNDGAKACELAKGAFNDAMAELDNLQDKDSTSIMRLLQENLTLWTDESENEKNSDQDYQQFLTDNK